VKGEMGGMLEDGFEERWKEVGGEEVERYIYDKQLNWTTVTKH